MLMFQFDPKSSFITLQDLRYTATNSQNGISSKYIINSYIQ